MCRKNGVCNPINGATFRMCTILSRYQFYWCLFTRVSLFICGTLQSPSIPIVTNLLRLYSKILLATFYRSRIRLSAFILFGLESRSVSSIDGHFWVWCWHLFYKFSSVPVRTSPRNDNDWTECHTRWEGDKWMACKHATLPILVFYIFVVFAVSAIWPSRILLSVFDFPIFVSKVKLQRDIRVAIWSFNVFLRPSMC